MNTIREIEKINQLELDRGIAGTSASWHSQFANSAWCYVGNLDHQLTEGDVLCIMSQFGELEDIHLVREEDTGKSRGFAFIKYEDARSCVLAVDNFCGIKILGRSLRVDHVEQYRLPKKLQDRENEKDGKQAASSGSGHAYEGMEFENKYNIQQGMDLFAAPAQDKKNADEDSKEKRKMEKMQRKEERQRKRLEKEERRRKREGRRDRHEEKKRRKRAREYDRSRDDDSR